MGADESKNRLGHLLHGDHFTMVSFSSALVMPV